jgi:hypothetical protein
MSEPRKPTDVPVLRVRTSDGREFRFTRAFRIGRERDCDVCLREGHVSRKHVLVSVEQGRWSIRDLESASGLFVHGRRVDRAAIAEPTRIALGAEGPFLTLEVEPGAAPTKVVPPVDLDQTGSLDQVAQRYFGGDTGPEGVGARTRMIRKAFEQVQKKQKRRYTWVFVALGILVAAAGGYAYYAHRQMRAQQRVAQELFYSMKALDVSIAGLQQALAAGGQAVPKQVAEYLEQRRQMERDYEGYLQRLDLPGDASSEQDRLILRVTRRLGECELAAPPGYVAEVTRYIRKWQSTGTFARAVKLAHDMGYAQRIADEFRAQDLPPQFFYLALQESTFNAYASGPPTYMGIAKGMWQFIPDTGRRYGLKIGPLMNVQQPDPADDRHDWEKATRAAARYIKDIYATDAQASALLVMASYNWGEGRVIRLLRSMPANPRERNFWQVLEKHADRLPPETYNYVFAIVAAAVIGENPRLFGFEFDNPLAFAEKH